MNQPEETAPKTKPGNPVMQIHLPGLDGEMYSSKALAGKRYMITFFRFAACPFCNLRLHSLVKHYDELGSDFTIIAIFDSPLDNLQQHAKKHQAPFPILADETGHYYRKYAINHSIYGMLKGMFVHFPSLLKAVFKHGYVPLKFKGKLHTMPASFLVDEKGIINTAYYGKDEGDHIPFERVKQFSQNPEIKNIDEYRT